MSALVPVASDIWIAEGETVNFHGFPYPTRSVIVRLQNGGLWIWSPIQLSDALKSAIRDAGRPAHLVSPNKLHHLFLRDWHAAFPEAQLWGPATAIRSCPGLAFQPPLTAEPPAAWAGQIDQCWIRGSFMMDEIAFFHLPSRTAIVADLIQNFSSAWLSENWASWQRILARWSGIVEGRGYAPLDWRMTFIGRNDLRAAKRKIMGWRARNAVIAHGVWNADGGEAFLARALGWIG